MINEGFDEVCLPLNSSDSNGILIHGLLKKWRQCEVAKAHVAKECGQVRVEPFIEVLSAGSLIELDNDLAEDRLEPIAREGWQ